MKLRDDLFTAKNSADLLSEMLSGISIQDPADVKQVWNLQLPSPNMQLEEIAADSRELP